MSLPDSFPEYCVLLADEDPLSRTRLVQGLRFLYPKWTISETATSAAMLSALDTGRCDVAISNLALDAHRTFDLATRIAGAHPHLPVVLIAEGCSEETARIAQPTCQPGRWTFLRRPVEFPELIRAIEELMEDSAQCRVEGFSLVSFLQLMELDGKSAMLRILDGERRGLLYFREGQPQYAATEDSLGDAALVDMLSWRRPQIRVYDPHESRTTNLSGSLKGLLLDACHNLDQRRLQPMEA